MDFRTKPTVQTGITIDNSFGTTRFIEYQPGNGTRYQLILVGVSSTSGPVNDAIGFGPDGGWIVSFPLGKYRTACLSNSGYLSRDYLAAKIDSKNESDVAVLTELLGFLLNRRVEKTGP
jgi:hypothetical protein